MKNNNYFIPDIEDICIGYEYEQLVTPLSESLGKGEEEWMKCKFPDPFTIDRILLLYERKEQLRVPYLTKEQIESYNWKLLPTTTPSYLVFIKITDNYRLELEYDLNSNFLRIREDHFKEKIKINLFKGKCRCINEFKKIIKLIEL